MPDKKVIFFLAKFFAFFVFFHWLLFVVDTSFLQESIAGFEAGILSLPFRQSLVFIGSQSYAITPSCTGLVSAIILGAIIFSLKRPEMDKKMWIFLAGFVGLFLINLVRVYFVLVVGRHYGAGAAETVHVASWLAMSAGIIGAWYFLTKKITGIKSFDGFL